MVRPVLGCTRLPSCFVARTVTAVSSWVSRTAASSADSPGSTAPDGNCQDRSPSATLRRTIRTLPSSTMMAAEIAGRLLSVVWLIVFLQGAQDGREDPLPREEPGDVAFGRPQSARVLDDVAVFDSAGEVVTEE